MSPACGFPLLSSPQGRRTTDGILTIRTGKVWKRCPGLGAQVQPLSQDAEGEPRKPAAEGPSLWQGLGSASPTPTRGDPSGAEQGRPRREELRAGAEGGGFPGGAGAKRLLPQRGSRRAGTKRRLRPVTSATKGNVGRGETRGGAADHAVRRRGAAGAARPCQEARSRGGGEARGPCGPAAGATGRPGGRAGPPGPEEARGSRGERDVCCVRVTRRPRAGEARAPPSRDAIARRRRQSGAA